MHCVDITRREHHAEYEKVLDMFKVTLPSVKIVKIERIQNPHLYQMYEGKKITKSNGGNEMQLYHGTAKSAVKNINSTGFNRSYCGKNGKLTSAARMRIRVEIRIKISVRISVRNQG